MGGQPDAASTRRMLTVQPVVETLRTETTKVPGTSQAGSSLSGDNLGRGDECFRERDGEVGVTAGCAASHRGLSGPQVGEYRSTQKL